jgi:adenine phosphoribosyltransferase
VDPRLAADVKASLRAHADFPRQGVLFQDVLPLLGDPALLARVVGAMAEPWAGGRFPEETADPDVPAGTSPGRVDRVVGIESRGFILGAPVALRLGVGFAPVRKAGKLPGATLREDCDLEYGKATLEVQRDAIRPGERVLVVDDVVATAGTALASARLVERAGATVAGYSFLLGIAALRGLERLGPSARALLSV